MGLSKLGCMVVGVSADVRGSSGGTCDRRRRSVGVGKSSHGVSGANKE